ncbi:MAG: glycosyltransferase [Salinivirgaceae bacterium]|nr:glycosyltransferase [Salinivirgaceae bacterium]
MKIKEEMNYKYDITVVLASYKPFFSKLIKTINSILKQKSIRIQLIICDDGSPENFFDEIKDYLHSQKFEDYKLVESKENKGTCINYYRGVKWAEGKYVKGISPGDYFYDENVLNNWFVFLETNNVDLSFGRAVFYGYDKCGSNVPSLIKRHREAPAIPAIYSINYNTNIIRNIRKIDWLINRDSVYGVQIICKTSLCLDYLERIINKVIYAEDYSFRIMLLDDIDMIFFPHPVIYYEYGLGVSSDPVKKKTLLAKDELFFYESLKLHHNNSHFYKKYLFYRKITNSKKNMLLSMIMFPLSIPWRIFKYIYVKLGKSKPNNQLENGMFFRI